jgi:hypothetical protein
MDFFEHSRDLIVKRLRHAAAHHEGHHETGYFRLADLTRDVYLHPIYAERYHNEYDAVVLKVHSSLQNGLFHNFQPPRASDRKRFPGLWGLNPNINYQSPFP